MIPTEIYGQFLYMSDKKTESNNREIMNRKEYLSTRTYNINKDWKFDIICVKQKFKINLLTEWFVFVIL